MASDVAKKLLLNLKIIPTDENGIPFLGAPFVPFIAMFNPESFSVQDEIEWTDRCVPGTERSDATYSRTKPRTFSIEFTLDGTGVNGAKIPVTAQVILFRLVTTNMDGTIHRPPYLMVQYGTFVQTCVLKSSTVTYSMFDSNGLPLRAKINASFTERSPTGLSAVLSMLSSPDLTHEVTVKDGDILPLLTYKTYKDQNYYLQVAKVNRLKNFRKLKAGESIIFPPIDDK